MLYEAVVLLCCGVGERLKPVGTVSDTELHSPFLHASSYLIGCSTVQWRTVVDDVEHLVIYFLWEVFEHLLLVEDVFSEVFRRALCWRWDVERLLLECLCHYLKS